jgi:RimJ/RimL family protein N-acetyltransferase
VFDHTACTRVLAMTDARNLPSERLLIGLGFVLAGSGEATFHGEPCTELTYVLSRP